MSSFSNGVKWIPAAPAKVTASTRTSPIRCSLERRRHGRPRAPASNPHRISILVVLETGWTLVRDYAPGIRSPGPRHRPTRSPCRRPGVGASRWIDRGFDSYLGTPSFAVTVLPFELSADVDFPTPPGNQVTWTAKVAAARPILSIQVPGQGTGSRTGRYSAITRRVTWRSGPRR